jgi:DNA polymerase-3 subunit alpha
MEVAKLLAGYSLGAADMLRRAMGKKIKAEMDAQRDIFVKGAVERGLDRDSADTIFDLLAKFADYGFNKSHAAAYALIAYQTAYLKANFPVEFLAASMTLDLDNTDKLGEFRREAQRLGIKVEPPSINRSNVVFEVERDAGGEGAIRYALAAIKGVGRGAVESLVDARGDQPFRSLTDLAQRVNPRLLNKRTLESLVAAGALDELEPDRARATAAIDGVMGLAQRAHEMRTGGALDMFGGVSDPAIELRVPLHQTWPASERLRKEYEAVGFFLQAIRLTSTASFSGSCASRAGPSSAAPRRQAAVRSAGSRQACSTGRSAAPRAAARWGS